MKVDCNHEFQHYGNNRLTWDRLVGILESGAERESRAK